MADPLKLPDPPDKEGGPGGQSSARICPSCGATYFGAFHKDCSNGPTIKRPAHESSIDEIPGEALPFAEDKTRQLNQYVLVKQIGRGGMGTVWKAWDRNLTRWTAIKFLLAQEEADVLRFQREAKLAARLRHPNIAAVYEVGRMPAAQPGAPPQPFLAMEFIEGKSLQETKLPIRDLIEVFLKVAQGIDSAHRSGVIHRDLKPHNIMVTPDRWPYVMDFGLAKALMTDSSLSVTGAVMGTPAFMPPEQAEGKLDEIDARTDVYSFGATMYACFCGRPPFTATTALEILAQVCRQTPPAPRSLNAEIPAGLETVILKAMAKKAADRYASILELADDLKRVMGNEPVAAKLPPPSSAPGGGASEGKPEPPKKSKLLLLVGIGAAVGVLAVVGFIVPAPTGAPPSLPAPVAVGAPPPSSAPGGGASEGKPPLAPIPEPPPPAPKPEPAPPPPSPAPAAPSKTDELEREWRALQPLLAWGTWAAGDDALSSRVNRHLAAVEAAGAPAQEAIAARWFSGEVEKARSAFRAAKPAEQQALARRIAAWSDALGRSAKGVMAFQDVERAAGQLRSEVDLQLRGTFTLQISPVPYAQITRLLRDGKPVSFPKHDTPVVIKDLDIADYELDLAHPDLGTRTVKLLAKDLMDRKTTRVSGKMADPALKVERLP